MYLKNYTFLYFLLLVVTVSCKDNKKEENINQGTHIIVNPTVSAEEYMGNNNSLMASNKAQANASTQNIPDEVQYLDGLDAIMSSPNVSSTTEGVLSTEPASPNGKLLAQNTKTSSKKTQRMNSGARFRLVIMKGSASVLNNVFTAGQRINITLDGQQTYTWYAISFDDTSRDLPEPNAAGIIQHRSLENRNFLFAKGTLEAKTGVNYLNLSFKQMTSRIHIKLDVRGLFARINNTTSISLTKNGSNEQVAKSGDFNIFTGTYINIQNSRPLTASAMSFDTSSPNGTVKTGDIYTIDTTAVAAGNLKLRLNEIHVTLDDGRVRSFTKGHSITYKKAYTPKFGNQYELNVRLIEAAVKVKNIHWSRSNIVYNSAHADSYRLKSNPGGSTSANGDTEFWNWKVSTPNSMNFGRVDPCTRLYPEGVWRMPTEYEWMAIGQPDKKEENLGLMYGAQYAYIWNRDSDFPANNAYDDNNLFLSFGGFRDTWGSVQQTPLGLGSGLIAAGQCHYWTSSEENGLPVGVLASFSRLAWGFSWADVTYPTSTPNNGKNIRCVRNIINK